MDEDGLIYLGAALWLRNHGCGWVAETYPDLVVPVATALRESLHRMTAETDAEADR